MTIRAAHGLDLVINERYDIVRWVYEGQRVFAPVTADGKETALRCVVTVTAGLHARIENKEHGFAQWYEIRDLRVDTKEIPAASPDPARQS